MPDLAPESILPNEPNLLAPNLLAHLMIWEELAPIIDLVPEPV